jgi:hypothetical protein
MRSTVFWAIGLLGCSSICTALCGQDLSNADQATASPPNARFQIIQSELAARWTFRRDRFTGQVAQLVHTKEGESAWESMPVQGLSSVGSPVKPHFQIFTSGLAARHTFLIDTDTGKTWIIVTVTTTNNDGTKEESSAWQPFPE